MNITDAFIPRINAGVRTAAILLGLSCTALQTPAIAVELNTLVHFNVSNGSQPLAGLALDAAGKLYGTTWMGGQYYDGTVFQLTPPAPGKTAWTRKTLVNFNGTNGEEPVAGLVVDAAGNLFGTTSYGGQYGNGTVFQLTPPAPGQTAWTRKTLVSFDGANGANPRADLVVDAAGKLYGTTEGGAYNRGTVFQLTP